MVLNLISQPNGAAMEPNAIAKIRKYKRFHKGHHFILMAMEVHNALGRDMDHFIRECARPFHNKQLGGNLSLSFCIQFFGQCVNIVLQHGLISAIERKIVLVGDACSRPPIIIGFHDLHAINIKGAMGEITSYHERTNSLPFLLAFFWPSFFHSPVMVSTINLLLDFFNKIAINHHNCL
jgi:hypothetical protein